MKLKLYHELLIRVPLFPLDAQLSDEWLALKEAIKIASEDFYSEIKNVAAEDIPLLAPRIIHSIWKYFNRGKYRPTPFGSFAGTGIILKLGTTNGSKITISQQQCLHERVCWTETDCFKERSKPVGPETIVLANGTFYIVCDQIRYIIFEDELFNIAEIEFDELLYQILISASKPDTALSICSKFGLNNYSLLQQMVDLQLLIPNHEVNLIGHDYFDRHEVSYLNKMEKYILAERKIIKGVPNKVLFEHINELINLLANLAPNQKEDRLEIFKNKFLSKYEYGLIPIMEALDPEIGIGYGNMEEFILDDDLADLIEAKADSYTSSNNFGALYKMLFSSIVKEKQSVINLEDLAIEDKKYVLPNTLGVLCAAVDDKLVIEQIYGPSVNRISGRFNLIGKDTQDFCSKMAAIEIESNPEILFFDISYSAEINIDNINRREQIYPLQLSILNYDLTEQPIILSDLFLTVRNGELHLVSQQLKKRLIPRISSAYNYSRSDLSVYRLLCDLQNQGISRNFEVSLSSYFPGMDFYPRIIFRNIVVAPAQWKLHYEQFIAYTENSSANGTLRSYLYDIGLGRYVVTRTDDRTLCFDLENQQDLKQLLFIFKKFKTFMIEEGSIASYSAVVDNAGRDYNSHFLLSMYHRKEIYKCADYDFMARSTGRFETEKIFLPGSQWVFFEIYVHPGRSDSLLVQNILKLLTENSERISHWYFVRFDKNGPHIRLRLHTRNYSDIYQIITLTSKNLKQLIQSKVISDFKIATYERELERYGTDLIENTEMHFSKDSDFAIRVLQDGHSTMDKYCLCIGWLINLRDQGPLTHAAFDEMVERVGNSLLNEFSVSGNSFKEMNVKFKLFKKLAPVELTMSAKKCFELFELSLLDNLNICPSSRRAGYMTDLIHMHVNRLFCNNQRSHEMIIYYFLNKEIKHRKAMLDF